MKKVFISHSTPNRLTTFCHITPRFTKFLPNEMSNKVTSHIFSLEMCHITRAEWVGNAVSRPSLSMEREVFTGYASYPWSLLNEALCLFWLGWTFTCVSFISGCNLAILSQHESFSTVVEVRTGFKHVHRASNTFKNRKQIQKYRALRYNYRRIKTWNPAA